MMEDRLPKQMLVQKQTNTQLCGKYIFNLLIFRGNMSNHKKFHLKHGISSQNLYKRDLYNKKWEINLFDGFLELSPYKYHFIFQLKQNTLILIYTNHCFFYLFSVLNIIRYLLCIIYMSDNYTIQQIWTYNSLLLSIFKNTIITFIFGITFTFSTQIKNGWNLMTYKKKARKTYWNKN